MDKRLRHVSGVYKSGQVRKREEMLRLDTKQMQFTTYIIFLPHAYCSASYLTNCTTPDVCCSCSPPQGSTASLGSRQPLSMPSRTWARQRWTIQRSRHPCSPLPHRSVAAALRPRGGPSRSRGTCDGPSPRPPELRCGRYTASCDIYGSGTRPPTSVSELTWQATVTFAHACHHLSKR